MNEKPDPKDRELIGEGAKKFRLIMSVVDYVEHHTKKWEEMK